MITCDNHILEMISSAGEDHSDGPSTTRALCQCARRVRLDKTQEDGEPLAPYNEGRNVGTITHKLVWAHHSGLDPEEYVPRTSTNEDIDKLLNGPRKKGTGAWVMYEDYAEHFPVGFWGHPVGLEMELEGYLDDGVTSIRRTGILDALWDMDAETVERVENTFEIKLNGPGLYVWDLKTSTSLDPDLAAKWEWDPQPTQYQWLAEKTTGHKPRGMIVFQAVGYKTKTTAFQATFLQPSTDIDVERWTNQVYLGLANQEADDVGANQFCYNFFRNCPHRVSGVCDGV